MSNEDLANKLLKLKKEIREYEEEESRFKGKLDSAMENLGMSFEEATKKLNELKKKINTLQTEIEEESAELEEKYDL